MKEKRCLHCKKVIDPRESHYNVKKYCSQKCQRKNYSKSFQYTGNPPSQTKGDMNELRVIIDLVENGHQIFREVGKNEFDLVSWYRGKLYRVEVTTGMIARNNKIYHPTKDKNKFDVLAVVTPSGITYDPGFE